MRLTASLVLFFTFTGYVLCFGILSGCKKPSSLSNAKPGTGVTTGPNQDTFSNGGKTLTASVTSTDTSKTVTVLGDYSLTLTITKASATIHFPKYKDMPGYQDTVITFRQPLSSLPTDYTARRMAISVAGQLATGTDASVRLDSPGCDWFPDTQCTLGCCADHDKCYRDNNCGASSWIWGFGSAECKNCNNIAYDCIAAACSGVTESFTDNNCYDHACDKHYDCPPNKDNCECQSPCSSTPETCGNGKCEVGETLENCKTDCGAGNAVSECCQQNAHCPDETEDTCGLSCCCCGQGQSCNASDLCAPGDFF